MFTQKLNLPSSKVRAEMMADFQILLSQRKNIASSTLPGCPPEMIPQLATWCISRNATKVNRLQKNVQSSSLLPGDRGHWTQYMTHPSGSGWTGTMNGYWSRFRTCKWCCEFSGMLVQKGISALRSCQCMREWMDMKWDSTLPISRVMKGAFELQPPQPQYERWMKHWVCLSPSHFTNSLGN